MGQKYNRAFTDSRREQGFKDQAHLDRWFAYADHCDSCVECKRPGKGVMRHDGFQPTENRCEEALRLQAAVDPGR